MCIALHATLRIYKVRIHKASRISHVTSFVGLELALAGQASRVYLRGMSECLYTRLRAKLAVCVAFFSNGEVDLTLESMCLAIG